MVDIMDMEDIISDILKKNPYSQKRKMYDHVVEFYLTPIMEEIKDFVDCQKNIACNNCMGKKFKFVKEPCQVM